MSKKRPDKIASIAEILRTHADTVFFKIPIGEQFMGARDTAFHAALHQIAEALEYLEQLALKEAGKTGRR